VHGEGFFYQAFVYLAAAVVSVPIAKRLGLGSVLGYLLAGVAIGPFVLGLIGDEGQDVMHFAEFGVVMMLFLIGLELQPALLWRMRGPILGLGGLQVALTTAALATVGIAVGLGWRPAVAVGMILALSSTAIVLQTLAEKGLMGTDGGRSAFSVLLFQDIAVIPMLALLPLLATTGGGHAASAGDHGSTWVEGLPAWGQTLAVLAAVAVIVVGGRYLTRPAFRFIARTRLREIFTAAALMLVIGIALLMTKVGLSPALGTFLAGVVLATSEYRHELETDIDPFKGLLLGVFFIAVGASIDFRLIAASPGLIAGLVAALIGIKLVLLLLLGRAFRLGLDQNLLFAFALAQGGEFAFVLFSFAGQHHVLGPDLTAPLVAVVAVTMALTPVLLLVNEKLLQPRVGTRERDEREADEMDEAAPVIIAGYGRVGNIVGRMLTANGVEATVLDHDSDQVDLLRRFGQRVFYGDATRHDLLESAGAANAKVLIVAVDDHETVLKLVETARKHWPHLEIMARAVGRTEAYDLLDAGVDHVYRETFDSSLRIGVDALRALGHPAYDAHRRGRAFRRHDERMLRELAAHRGDRATYIREANRRREEMERVLADDVADPASRHHDAGWDTDRLRADFGRRDGPSGSDP
jgi:monovalent cation:proton antiporter-2 (CPA2) family protein